MKKVHTHRAYGATAVIYEMDKGDEIPWHTHDYNHTHFLIKGSTRVSKNTRPPILTPPGGFIELIAGEEHKIESLENGTIFLHLMQVEYNTDPIDTSHVPHTGGVLLDDGTIVYD